MREVFYGLGSFIMLLFLVVVSVFVFTESKIHQFSDETTGLVIHKNDHDFFGQHVLVLQNDSLINQIGCYDILYHNVEVGDSIVNGEIRRK